MPGKRENSLPNVVLSASIIPKNDDINNILNAQALSRSIIERVEENIVSYDTKEMDWKTVLPGVKSRSKINSKK